MTKIPILVLLSSLLVLLAASSAGASEAASLRADLDTILWQDQSIDGVTGNAAADTLAEARKGLAALSDEQLEPLTPYANSIATLKNKTVLLASHVLETAEIAKVEKQARSAGFPDADYYTDDLCTGVRNDPLGLKIAWNALWAAETALDALEYVCVEDILGENGAAACIPLAVALGVASQVVDNYKFCDDDVNSSEIGGSYQRLGHLHGDTVAVQETLDQGTVEQIEVDLARRRFYVGEYMIPASSNGKLEQVRDVVSDVLQRMVAAGVDIKFAQSHLDLANNYYAAGDWKHAYKELGFAYREAVQVR